MRVALCVQRGGFSQLILGDDNSAARLLSRPGEAIYNDQGGLVEANSPFQIAWLGDEQREGYLKRVSERANKLNGKRNEPIVFEGNAAADVTRNALLKQLIDAPQWPAAVTTPRGWLGDPVAIKDPSAIVFRRQSGANVLIVGQQDESALAIMVSVMLSVAAAGADKRCDGRQRWSGVLRARRHASRLTVCRDVREDQGNHPTRAEDHRFPRDP